MRLYEKHEARIYTDKEENIEKIKALIKEMDEFEYDYLPKDLITVYRGEIEYVYNGKFDAIDMDELMKNCWNSGVYAFYAMKDRRVTFY